MEIRRRQQVKHFSQTQTKKTRENARIDRL
jgi:hypothetical protein